MALFKLVNTEETLALSFIFMPLVKTSAAGQKDPRETEAERGRYFKKSLQSALKLR